MQLANEFGQSLEFKTLSSTQTAGVTRGRLRRAHFSETRLASTELRMGSGYLLSLVAHFFFCECKANSTESRSGHCNGTSVFARLEASPDNCLGRHVCVFESVRVDGKGSGLVGGTG